MPSTPWDLKDVPHVNEADWDPLWATCQDLEVPVCFHSGSSDKVRLQAWEGFSPVLTAAMNGITGPVSSVPILANLLFSRILTRFPHAEICLCRDLPWPGALIRLKRQTTSLRGSASTTRATSSSPRSCSGVSVT